MNRKFAYLAGLMYGFDYAKEIKVGGLSDYITDKYDDNIVGFKKIFRTLYRHVFLLSGVSSLTSVIQTFTLYSVVAYSAIQKTISIGDFTMYISSISAASGCLLTIVSAMIDISKNTKYATDMRLFFEMERKTEMGGILPDRSANNVETSNLGMYLLNTRVQSDMYCVISALPCTAVKKYRSSAKTVRVKQHL